MENLKRNNSLFVICPFCQLEIYLQKKYGDDIFFMTATAGVLNFDSSEVLDLKDFIKREHITDIYLVNDIGCNFIEEAINKKKEFGLHAEKQLRVLLKHNQLKTIGKASIHEKKIIVAKINVQQQVKYLESEKFLKNEVENSEINIHTLITNKCETIKNKFNLY